MSLSFSYLILSRTFGSLRIPFPIRSLIVYFIYSFSFSDWVILRASLFSFLQRPLTPQSHVISFLSLVYT